MNDIDLMTHVPLPDLQNRRWAAGVFLYHADADGRRYLLLRSSKHGEWGFPKGHADPGETLRQAAVRETAEEAGIGLFALRLPGYVIRYRVREREKIVCYWPAHTRQTQPSLSDEHHEHIWLPPERILAHLDHANLRELFRRHLQDDGLCP